MVRHWWNNTEEKREYSKRYESEHPGALKKWRAENPEKVKAQWAKQRAKDALKILARNAKRRGHRLRATPPWVDWKDTLPFYAEARRLTMSGINHHVDHIVPLQGKNVCGLHVPWNLQVIPAAVNLRKGNKVSQET